MASFIPLDWSVDFPLMLFCCSLKTISVTVDWLFPNAEKL